MINKITLNYNPPTESEMDLINERDLGRFLTGAEEDYFLSRVLILSTIYELGFYHFQQCIEKFLKAYLIQKNKTFGNTHDLDKLRKLCAEVDTFFEDPDLAEGCNKITPFEVAGRYPSKQVRSYGYITPHILFFLDEFVSEMKKRIDHNGIAGVIGNILGTGRFSPIDSQGLTENMVEIFLRENLYFQKQK